MTHELSYKTPSPVTYDKGVNVVNESSAVVYNPQKEVLSMANATPGFKYVFFSVKNSNNFKLGIQIKATEKVEEYASSIFQIIMYLIVSLIAIAIVGYGLIALYRCSLGSQRLPQQENRLRARRDQAVLPRRCQLEG